MKRIQEDIAKIRRVANQLIASYPKAFTVEDIAKQLQKNFAKRGVNLPEQTFFEVVDEVLDDLYDVGLLYGDEKGYTVDLGHSSNMKDYQKLLKDYERKSTQM